MKNLLMIQKTCQAEKKQRTHSFRYIFRPLLCLNIKLVMLNKHVIQPSDI